MITFAFYLFAIAVIVVGVDIGGTFTDLMLYDTALEAVHVHKVRSTPAEPERAMVEGLIELCAQAGVEPGDVGAVYHHLAVGTDRIFQAQQVAAVQAGKAPGTDGDPGTV